MIVKRYGVEVDLQQEGKTGCPRCISNGRDNSRDNLHVYGLDDSGRPRGYFCHSCELSLPSYEYLESIGEDPEDEDYIEGLDKVGREFNKEVQAKLKEITGMDSRGYRGISQDVSQKYRVRYQYSEEDGSITQTLYPCTKDYKIAGYKVRSHPKDFQDPGPMGETGKSCDMFGQFLFKTHSNFCVIVGGEHDAMAGYEMLNKVDKGYQDMAVVSSTIGESGAHRQIKGQYEWFNQFKKIIVCMDEDEAGDKAADKICQALPRGKVLVMKMRHKDPNTYLDKRDGKSFVQDFWAAQPYTPAGIHSSTSLYEKAISYSDLKQLCLPEFLKTSQDMFDGGLVKNELSVLFAETSSGKSAFADAMCVNWILNEPEEVVGVLSLEATADKWATNIISKYLGVKLISKKGQDRKDYLERGDVREKVEPFLAHEDGTPRFYVCDERGAGIEVVKEKIMEMIIQMGVTILVVDVVSDLSDGMSLHEQEGLTSWFKKLIKEYPQLSVFMVAHTRKRQSGGTGKLVESDIMGSSTLMKSAAQTISLERDKLAESDILRNCTFVSIHKNRHFSDTGPAGVVYYDPETGRLWDVDTYLEMHPEREQAFMEALSGEENFEE